MSAIQIVTVPWVVDSLKAFIGTYVQTQIPKCGPQQNVDVEFCVNPDELMIKPSSPQVGGMWVSFAAKVSSPPEWEVTDIVVDLAHVDRSIFQPVPLSKSSTSGMWLVKEFLDFWRLASDRYAINRFNCSTILVYITLKHSRLIHGFDDNQQTLTRMFEDSLWTDFQVRVGEEKFFVHKAILAARSKVFAAMFESGMKERDSNYVEIIDFDPAVVKAMLEYVYTGRCNTDPDLIWDLILISDKYGLNQLRAYCEEHLGKQIQEKNLGRVLILSDQISSNSLKDRAIEEIILTGPKFLDSDEWKLLENNNIKLATQVLKDIWKTVHQDPR